MGSTKQHFYFRTGTKLVQGNGKPLEFDSKADAENYAKEANEHTTANVRYYVKEKEPEPGAVRKGTSQPELDARSHEEVIPRMMQRKNKMRFRADRFLLKQIRW